MTRSFKPWCLTTNLLCKFFWKREKKKINVEKIFFFFFYEAIWHMQRKWQNLFYTASPVCRQLWKLLMTLCWQVREQLETPQGALLFIFILCLIKKKKKILCHWGSANCKAFCVILGKCLTNSVDKDSHYYFESTDFSPPLFPPSGD